MTPASWPSTSSGQLQAVEGRSQNGRGVESGSGAQALSVVMVRAGRWTCSMMALSLMTVRRGFGGELRVDDPSRTVGVAAFARRIGGDAAAGWVKPILVALPMQAFLVQPSSRARTDMKRPAAIPSFRTATRSGVQKAFLAVGTPVGRRPSSMNPALTRHDCQERCMSASMSSADLLASDQRARSFAS